MPFYERLRPQSQDKHIGLEIEFHAQCGPETIMAALQQYKLAGYVSFHWEPITYSRYGWEARMLCTEEQFPKLIRRFIAALRKVGARVDRDCGLHVHLDMRSRDVAQAYAALVTAQDKLYSQVADYRRESEFCMPNRSADWDTHRYVQEKSTGINPHSFYKHGTLEVRMHEGALNTPKIRGWVKLLLSIVDSAAQQLQEAA